MADFDDIIHLDIINALEEAEIEVNTERRVFSRTDAFTLPENQFIKLFRLNKHCASDLITNLENYMQPASRSSALDVSVKVLTALRFFASGSYQTDIGLNVYTGISQASVSRSVREVSEALNHPNIFGQWVKFPGMMPDLINTRNKFHQMHRFPGVVGCIDCTHVAIIAPKQDEHIYVNRKGYHSINVQLVCDSDLKIIHVNARYPGSTNDAFIWNNSNLKQYFINLHSQENNSFFLLGDSGYPLRSYLLTPIINPEPLENTPEYRYNERQMATRATIERCNGVLKMRFRCLLKHRVLHYSPEMASKIINACVVLHNICIENKIPEQNLSENVDDEENDFGIIHLHQNDEDQIIGRVNPELAQGRNARRNIVRNYFT